MASINACCQPPNWVADNAKKAACDKVSNDSANDQRRMRNMTKISEQASLDANRLHHFMRLGGKHGNQIEATQRDQKDDGNHRPDRPEPGRHFPMPGNGRHPEGDSHYNSAMPQGEQRAAITGQTGTVAGVIPGQTVDGRQMIRIEAMLHAEYEGQDQPRQPVRRWSFHHQLQLTLR